MPLSPMKKRYVNLGIADMGGVIASEALYRSGSIPTKILAVCASWSLNLILN